MGKVFFTRHGQTIWNVENKICGATDIELTELGHRQNLEENWQKNSRGSMRYYIPHLFVRPRLPDIYRK